MPSYHRLGHLKSAPLFGIGASVNRGDLVGYVGTSGASSGPHLHYDIITMPLESVKALGGFIFYVYRRSYVWVKARFSDPTPFIKNGIPCAHTVPQTGYKYLQGVRDRSYGLYFHPGIDVNGVNDYGKPVYSPVYGRVVYSQAPRDRVWSRLFGWLPWGNGWGNMLVIEEAVSHSQFTPAQIEQLDLAAFRVKNGTASAADKENLAYAVSKGYVQK